ncbi:MAG: SpoIIE family protein phosphatase [Bacteroidales bacterium]|nr:SpoIIE family protein phosphatase [Bacteroidales bacterium]
MKYILNLITFSLFILNGVNSQEVVFPVTNYTTKDYGLNFHPTNLAVVQDHRGIIYAANGFKLLEYDGNKWNSYPINKETWILSLAVDSSGIIYAGSQNEFGMFAPDFKGELKYRSLSDSLDIKDIDFTNVWKVHCFSGGVLFQAEEKMFLYKNGKTIVINPETSFHTSFIVNDRLYVRERGTGLLEWNENTLVRIKGSEIFDTTGIFLMLPFGRGKKNILIGTQEKGFWLFNPENNSNPFRKFDVEDLRLLEKAKITGGVLTGEGLPAISTMLNGVVIIDTAGRTKALINNRHGLIDNDVKQVIPDQSQNLWVALNKGLSRIEISSPLSVNNEKSGITGDVNAVIRFKNLLYAGTTTGLFVQETGNDKELPFKPAYELNVPVRSMIEVNGVLLAGTDAGLFQISGKNIMKLGNEPSFTLFYSDDMKLLLSGGNKGLTAYKSDGNFTKINSVRIEEEDILGIAGEKERTGTDAEFWIGTRYNGIIRIKVTKEFSIKTDSYITSDGLPEGWIIPASFNSKTLFQTTQGLYCFTNENIVRESLPDSLKDKEEFSKGYFSEFVNNDDNFGEVVSFITETKNKIWVCADNRAGYLDKTDSMLWVSRPFNGIEAGKINTIYPEDNGVSWIGTTDGLIRFDGNILKDYDQYYHTLIRKVTLLNNDSIIFSGTNFSTDQGVLKITTAQNKGSKQELPYRFNSVRFDFSAAFYEYSDKTLFSYRLGGNDSKWSQWTKETFREYTNLHDGEYTFSVKARNIYGTESIAAQYSFNILPPWYRSVVAYISYVILAIILFWLFARLYSYRLKRENIRLEGIVTERTAEVVRQKDEIVSKNIVLEYQKKEIEDSIRYARRIQSAVIPSEKVCREILPESFVVFKPLNIVSGDFYWISRVGNKTIFTAADCTGHGVPGAFMSMLGVAFLNEIVNKDNVTSPEIILNHLREKVIQALQQQGISGEARDGMDIAIVAIDNQEKRLEYAGAYNPLIMIRNGEVTDTCGDKMPIGIYENMHPFTRHEIAIEKGDVFYMASDGYEDQFGGPDGKKFKSKRLKQLLLEIHKYPMDMQKEILEKTFEEWKGDLPQVDDVVLVGLSVQ